MKTLHVSLDQNVTIPCERCGRTRTTQVPFHIRGCTPVRVTCPCGEAIEARFEFRQTYRKDTFLQGLLQRHVTDVVGQAVQVRNLSQGGVMLTTRWWRNIHKHDVLNLTFILDNPQRSKINKRIFVQHINKQLTSDSL